VQARALGLFFDQVTNLLDPDAFLIGGGAIEISAELQTWVPARSARAESCNVRRPRRVKVSRNN